MSYVPKFVNFTPIVLMGASWNNKNSAIAEMAAQCFAIIVTYDLWWIIGRMFAVSKEVPLFNASVRDEPLDSVSQIWSPETRNTPLSYDACTFRYLVKARLMSVTDKRSNFDVTNAALFLLRCAIKNLDCGRAGGRSGGYAHVQLHQVARNTTLCVSSYTSIRGTRQLQLL